MQRLLLLLAAVLLVPTASAQWMYDGFFPNADDALDNIHGIAVGSDGNVWVMPYYPFSRDSVAVTPFPSGDSGSDCNTTTGNCRVTALYVYQPDGMQAAFSPLVTVDLPGGGADTLGGETFLNGDGNLDWRWIQGTGLAASNGSMYAAYKNTLYKMDESGNVLDVLASTLDDRGLAGPGVDNTGAVYLTGIFNGDPVAKYNANLDFVENLQSADLGFNRTLFAYPDGNTVIIPNYSSQLATVMNRPDDLTPYDSLTETFSGMAVESMAIHPTSGKVWASAGSPNDFPTGEWAPGRRYQPHTWYEFDPNDLLDTAISSPAPSDSIKWDSPGDGRPRAIAFSPDGLTAYVGEFSLNTAAIQKFVFTGTSVANGPEIDGVTLHQNVPNPFSGSTDITFELDNPANVRVQIYDVTGREVRTLASGAHASGPHTVTFDAAGLAGGIYVFALEVDGQRTSRRMLHMR